MAAYKHTENPKEQPSLLEQQLTKLVVRIVAILIVIVAIMLVVIGIRLGIKKRNSPNLQQTIQDVFHSEEGKVTTITQSTLEKIVTTGKLYTAEYPYNGIAAVYEGDVLKYHVAYEGTVKAGIDISKILLYLDAENHTIVIRLPDIVVEEPVINAGTLDFIFENDKYNTETVAQEAYKAAISDLKAKVAADPEIKKSASRTAKMYEKAFVSPLVEQLDPDNQYEITVLEHGEAYK